MGYDISDYRDIDPMFGTLQDPTNWIEALHARGIRLIMDLVVNQAPRMSTCGSANPARAGEPQARLVPAKAPISIDSEFLSSKYSTLHEQLIYLHHAVFANVFRHLLFYFGE